jgi:hypothetical protein
MKTISLFRLALLVACGGLFAQETFPGGIVYGPKAAFKIDAPAGWVLDNSAGAEQGLPCVLYPKGSTWSDANVIMYAKIAGTDYEDVGKFVAMAIQQMEKVHANRKRKSTPGKRAIGVWPTSNCPRQSLTSYSRHETKRAIAKIFQRSMKCLNPSLT